MNARLLVVLGLWLGGCEGPNVDSGSDPELEIKEGDPCNWSNATCLDEHTLLRCLDRVWTPQSCDGYCASLGAGVSAGACEVEQELGDPTQLCECRPAPDGCYPRQGTCVDEDTISWCADDWTWQGSSCTSVCEAHSLLSLGCSELAELATCLCTQIGTTCDAQFDTSTCADGSTLVTCEAGLWTAVDCGQGCESGGTCAPGASEEAGCVCD